MSGGNEPKTQTSKESAPEVETGETVSLSSVNDVFDVYDARSGTTKSDSLKSENKKKKYSKNDLEDMAREWNNMKPGLERLVAIESDLQYLINELSTLLDPQSEAPIAAPFGQNTESSTPEAGTAQSQSNTTSTNSPQNDPQGIEQWNLEEIATPQDTKNSPKKQTTSQAKETTTDTTHGTRPSSPTHHDQKAIEHPPVSSNETNGLTPTEQAYSNFEPNGYEETADSSPTKAAPTSQSRGELPSFDDGSAWIHLASYRSNAGAEQAWGDLTSLNGDVLDGLRQVIESVDLGNDGTYYRLKAGPFTEYEEATAICNILATRNQYCKVD